MVIIVLFYSFTDTFREELENTSNVPEDQIDEAIKMLKIEHALFFALIIFFDFVFHFLVINSLYNKYRNERMPNQIV
jgi:amino acid permease